MSDGNGTLSARILVGLFAAAIVAIASHQIHVRYAPKKTAQSPASREQLLKEFQGDLDVARASVSKEYVEKYSRKQNENEAKQESSGQGSDSGSGVDARGLKNLLNKIAP